MYKIGQKVRLWDLRMHTGVIQVVRDVVVTITEEKTGVPGEFSREPSKRQSLKGVAEDGTRFEKHWEQWPESQTNDFVERWSYQLDGPMNYWLPVESVYVYDMFRRWNQRAAMRLVGTDDKDIRPSGDNIVYCEKHDCYSYGTDTEKDCFKCRVRAHDIATAFSMA